MLFLIKYKGILHNKEKIERTCIILAKQVNRKSSLERMSSKDQLDKMIFVTSPSFWVALAGGALILIAVLVWAFKGSLPVKLEVSGIYVPTQKVYNLAADTEGIVSTVNVKAGEYVMEDDILVTLSNDSLQREVDLLKQRKEKVEAVTLESENDAVTEDTLELINIKVQLKTVESETEQQKAMLELYEEELEELTPKVEEAREELNQAKEEYFDSVDTITSNNNYSSVLRVLNNYVKRELEEYRRQKATPNLTEQQRNEIQAHIDEYNNLLEVIEDISRDTLISLEGNYNNTSSTSNNNTNQSNQNSTNRNEQLNNEKAEASANYSDKTSEYEKLFSRQLNLETNIDSIKAEIESAQIAKETQISSYKQQFEGMRETVLNSLDSEIEKKNYDLEKTKIKAAVSGFVNDVNVGVGAAVEKGTDIVTIRPFSSENIIVCYVPINEVQKIETGMQVVVKPVTVNEQEYGHMEAEVIKIDKHVANTGNESFVLGDYVPTQDFRQSEPVVSVTCKLRTDENTASGYWWSNEKGADIILANDTLVEVDIITEEKSPITILFPSLEEKSSVEVPQDSDGGEE